MTNFKKRQELLLSIKVDLQSFQKTINSSIFKNRLTLSYRKFFSEDIISTPCWKVFCQLRTNGKRFYWQLDFGSNLTIVSLYVLRW